MPSKQDLIEALDDIYHIARSEDFDEEDREEVAKIAGEVLGYEIEEEEEED